MRDLQFFSKYVGCGNDFILFDHRHPFFPIQDKELIRKLCHRQYGIGADGLILLENSSCADFKMRIFNADGSEAEMCGNGIRCLGKFIQELGFNASHYRIETMQRILSLYVKSEEVQVEMGQMEEALWNLAIPDLPWKGHFLNTGVPHVVLFVSDLEALNVEHIGALIRYHSRFAPQGTNVNFAEWRSSEKIRIRTYERGVEGETLACGTGATAVALAAAYQYQAASPIFIETRSREELKIEFRQSENSHFTDITLAGSAHCTFQGQISIAPHAIKR